MSKKTRASDLRNFQDAYLAKFLFGFRFYDVLDLFVVKVSFENVYFRKVKYHVTKLSLKGWAIICFFPKRKIRLIASAHLDRDFRRKKDRFVGLRVLPANFLLFDTSGALAGVLLPWKSREIRYRVKSY